MMTMMGGRCPSASCYDRQAGVDAGVVVLAVAPLGAGQRGVVGNRRDADRQRDAP